MKTVKYKVLMLGPLPPPMGGMATVLENLKNSSLSKRCDLRVIHTGKTTSPSRSIVQAACSQLKLLYRIVHLVYKEKIDIVHIHTCSGFTYWRDCLYVVVSKVFGCKVVLHVHGGFFDQFICGLDPVRKIFFKFSFKLPSSIVVLSSEWKNKLRQYAPCSIVLTNGVKIPDVKKKVNLKQIVFLFLGNLGKEKGVFDLVKAVKKSRKNGFKGVVQIAGKEIENGDKAKLESYIRELELSDQVHLLGEIGGQEKERILAGSDCLVLPSHGEGLPMAILEGMAYSMPVLATNVGAIPEVITHGQEGFLFDVGDVDALAGGLNQLDKSRNLIEKMGKKAKDRVAGRFSMEAMIDKLSCIYHALLSNG